MCNNNYKSCRLKIKQGPHYLEVHLVLLETLWFPQIIDLNLTHNTLHENNNTKLTNEVTFDGTILSILPLDWFSVVPQSVSVEGFHLKTLGSRKGLQNTTLTLLLNNETTIESCRNVLQTREVAVQQT